MNKKIATNFLYQAMYQVTLIVLPIVTIPIISHALGADGLGLWNYVSSIVSYFTLVAGLGLANYGVREIAIVKKSKELLSKKFFELQIFNAFFSLGTFIVYLIMILFLPNKDLYLAQSFVVLGALFDISWFFAGIEDFKKISLLNVFIKVVSFVCILLFVKNRSDLFLYVLIQSLSTFFSQLGLWLFLPKKVSWYAVSVRESWGHFRPALEFFIAKVGATIFSSITKTILGMLTTMTFVGIYSNSLTLVFMSGSIVGALNTVMIPHMSKLVDSNEPAKMTKILERTIHLQLYFTIAIMFGIIAINGKMIGWFYGSEFYSMVNTVPLLSISVVLQSLYNGIATQYLIPKGDMKSYNLSILYGAILSAVLDILLIPFIGIYGAILGNIFGQLLICAMRIIPLKKETGFQFNYIWIGKYIAAGVIMLGLINRLTENLPTSAKTTLIQVSIGIISYFIITIIFRVNPLISEIRKK